MRVNLKKLNIRNAELATITNPSAMDSDPGFRGARWTQPWTFSVQASYSTAKNFLSRAMSPKVYYI